MEALLGLGETTNAVVVETYMAERRLEEIQKIVGSNPTDRTGGFMKLLAGDERGFGADIYFNGERLPRPHYIDEGGVFQQPEPRDPKNKAHRMILGACEEEGWLDTVGDPEGKIETDETGHYKKERIFGKVEIKLGAFIPRTNVHLEQNSGE